MRTSNYSYDIESASQQAMYHMTKAKEEMMKDILNGVGVEIGDLFLQEEE